MPYVHIYDHTCLVFRSCTNTHTHTHTVRERERERERRRQTEKGGERRHHIDGILEVRCRTRLRTTRLRTSTSTYVPYAHAEYMYVCTRRMWRYGGEQLSQQHAPAQGSQKRGRFMRQGRDQGDLRRHAKQQHRIAPITPFVARAYLRLTHVLKEACLHGKGAYVYVNATYKHWHTCGALDHETIHQHLHIRFLRHPYP